MSREDIFADRRLNDRRVCNEIGKAPNGRCRRQASRRSSTRGFSAMPWYLRSNYTSDETTTPRTEQQWQRLRREAIRKVI